MVVEPGASKMIEIFFTPPQARPSQGEFEVEFVRGVKCYIVVSGTGKNVDVSLSTPTLALESTYISLVSQKTLRIRNHSDIPIKFSWKSFALVEEEEQEREQSTVHGTPGGSNHPTPRLPSEPVLCKQRHTCKAPHGSRTQGGPEATPRMACCPYGDCAPWG